MKKRLLSVAVAVNVILAMSCATAPPRTAPPQANVLVRYERGLNYPGIAARNAIVSSSSEYATRAGIEILEKGGNVVEAAIAVSFALSVHEMSLSGIGGEGTMQVYMAGMKEPAVIDFKGEAPGSIKMAWNKERVGPKSVLIPGVVAGCWEAYQKFGSKRVAWADLIAPAIRFATEGIPLNPRQAQDIISALDGILKNEYLRKTFTRDDLPLEAGDVYTMPVLAETLKAIAKGGPDAFYKGELARKMAADFEADGGVATAEDFASYAVKTYRPLKGSYRGMDVYATPGATGGLGIINALQILDTFDLKGYGYLTPQQVHVAAEAVKLGVADLLSYGDDLAFRTVDYDRLLSKEYAKARAARISMDKVLPADAIRDGLTSTPAAAPASAHTTHFVVADRAGNMVGWTQTLSGLFGSQWASTSTGVIFNNEMGNFVSNPARVEPRRRVLTTIAPTFLFKDGKPYMNLGAPGSYTIIPSIINVITNYVDFGKSIQGAIEGTRYFSIAVGSQLTSSCEHTMPEATVKALQALGHPIKATESPIASVQAIVFDWKNGWLLGGSDYRRFGNHQGL